MRRDCLVAVSAAMLTIAACGSDEDKVPIPDTQGVDIDFYVQHFERDLAAAAADTSVNGAAILRRDYPIFFDSVWLNLMVPGGRGASVDSGLVAAFRVQPTLSRLLDSTLLRFPVTMKNNARAHPSKAWEEDLRDALTYARVYFPDRPTPRVVSYISELALGAFTYGDELLGVGLDFHLGNGFEGYDPNVFPRYIQRSMNAAHIAPRAVEAYVSNMLGEPQGDRMLDQMIYNGKLLYLKQRLLPEVADTAVLGFGESALAWLRSNEPQMWAHYLDEELLYETKSNRIGKHIGPSPNAPGMPAEAPGGGANYIGYRIVQQWMARHPESTLADLVAQQDAQQFLNESRYKPR